MAFQRLTKIKKKKIIRDYKMKGLDYLTPPPPPLSLLHAYTIVLVGRREIKYFYEKILKIITTTNKLAIYYI